MNRTAPSASPSNLDELDHLLAEIQQQVTYVAGGTDLMIQRSHWDNARYLVNLLAVTELKSTLEIFPEGILVGAALPLTDLIQNRMVQKNFPILVEACRQIGSVQIQNRATLGGNIANASPAGDTLPVLAVLNAELWIGPRTSNNFQKKSVTDFMLGPGKNALAPNQYIAYIYLPFPASPDPYW